MASTPSPSSPILLHPGRLPLLLSLSRLAVADSRILSRRTPPALIALTAAAKRISSCKSSPQSLPADREGDGGAAVREDLPELQTDFAVNGAPVQGAAAAQQKRSAVPYDTLSLGIREPVYEVIEVKSDGTVSTKKISRRQLLKSSGLRLRDIRSVDPSLWLMNSMPSLLVRDQAILLNLGSLRAIAMHERVLVFDYHNRKGGMAFMKMLLPRLNPKDTSFGPAMPFELEVVEAALLSRIQRLETRLMDVEPRVSMGT